MDPLRNVSDPLHDRPDAEKELFRKITATCDGHQVEVVMGACMNVVMNVIRQQHETRRDAEQAYDAFVGTSKAILLDLHYDYMGNRRNIFPFRQIVNTVLPEIVRKML
jgi:hypothetical protein